LSQGASIPVCTNVQRLKTRPQFQAVLAGKTLARTTHFALHCADLVLEVHVGSGPQAPLFSHACVWLGAMVPKRWAKRAVTRNAIKRQIYTVSAQFEPHLGVAAHVVRLRAGFDRKQFVSATSELLKTAVRVELQSLFERACPGVSVVLPVEK
jgi:ribonuclease P protein component